MDAVVVDGLRITYRSAGEGTPLLLIHGGLCDSRDWTRQLDSLTAEHTVVAWDAPGHGGSDDLPDGFDVNDLADTLAGFVDALGLGRAHVLGLSLGSMIAIAFHDRHPDLVRSLVLASAYAGWGGSLPPDEVQRRVAAAWRDADRPIEEVAREFVKTLFPPGAPAALVEQQMMMIQESRPATTRAVLTTIATVDLRSALPRIDVPTLLLYGDADVRSPAPVADALHAQIAGSVLVRLPGVGHCGHLQAPELWDAEVLGFLRGLPDRRTDESRARPPRMGM